MAAVWLVGHYVNMMWGTRRMTAEEFVRGLKSVRAAVVAAPRRWPKGLVPAVILCL